MEEEIKDNKKKNLNEGHRRRLRERFLRGGLDGFLDYEVVELLLTLGTPRKDCKAAAKEAIKRFKDLPGVLSAPDEELMKIAGLGPSNTFGLRLCQAVAERYAKAGLSAKILIDSPQKAFEYLRESLGREEREHFVIICLDTRNNLARDYEVSLGTLNASLVHPREVFKKAILANSSHVIVAHNHPSGDPTPSEDDIATTRRLVEAGRILGIEVVDHIIIAATSFTSLREKGMM